MEEVKMERALLAAILAAGMMRQGASPSMMYRTLQDALVLADCLLNEELLTSELQRTAAIDRATQGE